MTHFFKTLCLIVLFTSVSPAIAEVFFTELQLKKTLFPSAELIAHPVQIERSLLKEIKNATSARLISKSIKVWEVRQRSQLTGWLFNAEVLGKHENILYALAINTAGTITNLEIMEYHETHGGEVTSELWRAQMFGKNLSNRLKLGTNIDNISGATLSCRHLVDGIHGLLIVHDRLLRGA
jgi:Na+-translocating ferredoxin:NAD+ oxidoreductase RnfG subunit